MRELSRDAFVDLLTGIRSSWAHFEQRDSYGAPDDLAEIRRWRRGAPTDPSYYADYAAMLARLAGRGRSLRRLKVVSEPLSEYHRWIRSMIAPIIEAGEATRWLPRRAVLGHRLPATDYYLLDGSSVVLLDFDGDGRLLSRLLTTEPGVVRACAAAFEECWVLGAGLTGAAVAG
ncbi:hypothetical protein GCM10010123_06640 [Pilimelia anulata]|uniref:DUF6879 domain-containing protein n=1 Tax=Pilimelia anulata TaxID=53371 RepID=A0A8J3B6Z5_9ACTN|nr:DUF6879 family protein [Pilimelia anulata]GGJ79344.1 hypothetical protein GCM10010123_06640 [Pilimelia anulata]